MSEIQNSGVFRQLEQLKALDSYTERVMQQTRDIEELMHQVLNSPDCSEVEHLEMSQEARVRIARLNQECPHIGQLIRVTGDVIESRVDSASAQYKMTETTYSHQQVWSAGYMALIDKQDDGRHRVRVGHLFNTGRQPSAEHPDIPLVRLTPTLYAFASIGNVDIETFGSLNGQDSERLQHELPELYKEFHGRIASAEDECSALYSLSNMRMPHDYDVPTDTLKRFEAYVYDTLGFDEILPYSLAAQGLVTYIKEGNIEAAVASDLGEVEELYVVPQHLMLSKMLIRGAENTVERTSDRFWSLTVKALGEDNHDNADLYVIPLARILGMQSLRKELHQDIVSAQPEGHPNDEEYSI